MSACTETYMVIGGFQTKEEAENVLKYISTQLFRFLVLLRKPSQDATKKAYEFVPLQDFTQTWSEDELNQKYDISVEDQKYIDSLIRPMDLGD